MDCNFVIDKIAFALESTKSMAELSRFGKGNYGQCSDLKTASVTVACGFFFGTLMWIIGIYVLHRGGWLWPRERREADRNKDKKDKKKGKGDDGSSTEPFGTPQEGDRMIRERE
ncbi:hypothetical protein AGDE_13342 [Angomonas deanei]|uniref:Uncharacterized protein n=1 Tax=Angomonas deanei TaxID=59799 RepID=A0A7G2CHY0_9TRYP|nr:hypothetical protein AGDE_13342 [Angomonas deanei]CAD2218293.1 hypothetical protein, conserved [Angomonas deanei]|eukprot:EPY22465.1 hypothetical protein AGDE_13342 [Angomonas deanei]